MKRFLILVLLVAVPVLIAVFFATSFSDVQPFNFNHFGMALAGVGFMYLGVSLYLKNKQRLFAMNLMLIGEICFVIGIMLFIWFYGY